jgi:hypothetical protein
MNFALFDNPGVLAPLHDLMSWLVPTPLASANKPAHSNTSTIGFKSHRPVNPVYRPITEAKPTIRASANKPLRIVRILEADHAPANVGRMVISGRMSDVCAELDRLAARESALH